MGLLMTGASSEICRSLRKLVDCPVHQLRRDTWDMADLNHADNLAPVFKRHDHLVIAHAAYETAPFLSRTQADLEQSFTVNCLSVVRLCERALEVNPSVRICIIGSASATKGSWDIAYWLAKASLHAYVRERQVSPGQQLVCVAPSGIECGMTLRRPETEIAELKQSHPKQRLVTAREVASLIHHLLFADSGYVTNTVVEMNGGQFARRFVGN
jgi:NAD(P)-dependent dehydrogenase (short-subunit alcohol dehydrogenase family)